MWPIIFSFPLGIILSLSLVIFSIRNRHETKICITILTASVFIAIFFAVLPTNWINEGETVAYPFMHKIFSAWLYSFSALGGGADINQLNSIPLGCKLKWIYYIIVYILLFFAPILTSGLILSYLGDSLARIRFFFKLRKKYYIFSELSENSLEMAKSIKKGKSEIFVFCNTKNADKTLCLEAKKLGSILLYKTTDTLKLTHICSKTYELYFLSEQEEENVRLTESFILNRQKLEKHNIIINAFAQSGTNIQIIESMMAEKTTADKSQFKIRFINEIALFCNDLLFRHPLYDLPKDKKEISVLLIGCGWLGLRMLKTVLWCGQILNHTLKICVFDKDAKHIEDKLYAECPEIKKYNTPSRPIFFKENLPHIEFHEVDVESTEFESKIKENLDATFICVSTGSDELNLSTTEKIYRIFRRQYNNHTPPIYTRVRKSVYSDNLVQSGSYLQKRNIHLFGTVASVYSTETLFNTKLECLAFATHLAYNNILQNPKENADYKKALNEFYASEYNRRSSMAAALHIFAKLAACGIKIKNKLPTEKELSIFEAKIKDNKFKTQLIENEHLRWNTYMRSEGYIVADFETMKTYAHITNSHKDEQAKLHPCILDCDELNHFQQKYNSEYAKLNLPKKDFKQNDTLIVSQIPQIVKNATTFMEEGF